MLAETHVDYAVQLMKKANLKVTKQRRDLIAFLYEHQDHYLPIKTVDQYLRNFYPRMSYETVYRNIDELSDLHIVEKRMFSSGLHVKFQCDFDHVQHSHFICENCGRVVELKEPPLAQVQDQLPDYQITAQHLEVFGLCPKCQL
ncbi:Fur family transcriptional regulator [Agrilactobacillus fermenti]|uniref:Fur family transcriptional regulator n=1 Tax=Agrilactobacillus fermenti TaxID=2586909 RepID=UPI001E3C9F2C|nr:Fur family transcriptional regulator [Agrilactobacillus fermenti]